MNELVKVIRNDIFTDSWIVADATGNSHEAVTKLLNKYSDDFEDFGELSSDLKSDVMSKRGITVYLLNELQATFLMTLMGNSKKVVVFKKELVKQFYQMRQYILEHQSPHWQQTRLESKTNRRMETDEIKLFVQYATDNGSKSPDKYYIHFSKLVNKAVGLASASRDAATTNQLNNLILLEHIVGEVIKDGIRQELAYKGIYQACKARLEQFIAIAYLGVAS